MIALYPLWWEWKPSMKTSSVWTWNEWSMLLYLIIGHICWTIWRLVNREWSDWSSTLLFPHLSLAVLQITQMILLNLNSWVPWSLGWQFLSIDFYEEVWTSQMGVYIYFNIWCYCFYLWCWKLCYFLCYYVMVLRFFVMVLIDNVVFFAVCFCLECFSALYCVCCQHGV